MLRRLPIYPVASAHIRTAHSSDYLNSPAFIFISPSTWITCLIILSFLPFNPILFRYEEVLRAAKHMLAMELAHEPRLRACFRQVRRGAKGR